MKFKITQVKSVIGRPKPQRLTIRALGLKRLNQSIIHDDKPEIRGMMNKVIHLLKIEELDT
ncbi:MAG: 50S ribosomal protein L30 [Actinobacteria bacterium]|nr:50S ribosomal protein L30 [Actinomycetota bacterium]